MKNIQVIDGAENCTYEVYSIRDESFLEIFPNEQDVEFVDDFIERVGSVLSQKILNELWEGRQDKKQILGIHGTLYYEMDFKKKYYPSKKEDEMQIVI